MAHDFLRTLAGTIEGGPTVAALPAEEMTTAMLVANATLAALEPAEITWNLQRIAGRR